MAAAEPAAKVCRWGWRNSFNNVPRVLPAVRPHRCCCCSLRSIAVKPDCRLAAAHSTQAGQPVRLPEGGLTAGGLTVSCVQDAGSDKVWVEWTAWQWALQRSHRRSHLLS